MYTLTITIPAYNSSSFLHICLDSLVDNRTVEDLEILVIDDGSKDNTYEVATSYSNKYKNVRVIRKENGGHGSVINTGLLYATGKFFRVLDSDDWVEQDNLYKLIQDLKTMNDIDMVLNSFYYVDASHNNKKKLQRYVADYNSIKGIEYLRDIKIEQLFLYSITIKTDLIRDSKYRFTEKCFYEDFQYALYPVMLAETIIFKDYPIYDYLKGQKTQSVSNENSLKNINMLYTVLSDSYNVYCSNKDSYNEFRREYFYNNLLTLARQGYNVFVKNYTKSNIENLLMSYDNKVANLSKDLYSSLSHKYPYILLIRLGKKSCLLLCWILLKIYKKIKGLPE